MVQKSGKWYADWRDEHGRRHRRAFTSKRSAVKFAKQRSNEAHSKKAHASGLSAKSRRRGKKAAAATATTPKSRAKSRARGRRSHRTS